MSMKTAVRWCVATTLLSLSTFLVSTPNTVSATSLTPSLGSWNWCTDTVVNGCIESVTTVSPEKVTNTYMSAAELPAGLSVSARCSANGPSTSCDGNKYENNSDGVCVLKSSWAGGFTTPSIEMDVDWASRSGWEITLRLSTGNFRPAFLIGHGTRSTQITSDGDGTFTFTFTSIMEFAYSAPLSQNRIPAEIATFGRENVHVQLWPRDHLLSSYLTQPMGSPTPIGRGPCVHYPFSGAWAEANAQGFSWSYTPQNPLIGPPSTDAPIANKLTFQASAPHYKPQVGSQPLEVISARVQIFLPTAYFRSLGYETVDQFDSSSYSVVTADGQSTTPTISKREDGLVINLGISHYSAPNPEVTFVVKGNSLATTDVLKSTPPLVRTVSSSVPQTTTTKTFSTRKGATVSSSRIARELGVSLKSARKIVLSVSGTSKKVCRVSGQSVKALGKGTCSVSLKVTAKNGKTKTYRQRITVQ
jgi:hypothetical protein